MRSWQDLPVTSMTCVGVRVGSWQLPRLSSVTYKDSVRINELSYDADVGAGLYFAGSVGRWFLDDFQAGLVDAADNVAVAWAPHTVANCDSCYRQRQFELV